MSWLHFCRSRVPFQIHCQILWGVGGVCKYTWQVWLRGAIEKAVQSNTELLSECVNAWNDWNDAVEETISRNTCFYSSKQSQRAEVNVQVNLCSVLHQNLVYFCGLVFLLLALLSNAQELSSWKWLIMEHFKLSLSPNVNTPWLVRDASRLLLSCMKRCQYLTSVL